MEMIRFLFSLLVVAIASSMSSISAESIEHKENFTEEEVLKLDNTPHSLAVKMAYQRWCYPQEKVYVMTDRGAYFGGDTVRFRAFLVDAASNRQKTDGSKFVYVELNDPFGQVAERVKVLRTDKGFAGYIPLNREMADGIYTLTAYTVYMQNQGCDYFFRKSLPIRSNLSLKYDMDAGLTAEGRLKVSVAEKGSGRAVSSESLTLHSPSGQIADAGRKKSSYTFKLSDEVREAGVVKVQFDNYHKFVALPADTGKIHVSFHPQGGYMIPGEVNTVAFKAIDGAGRGIDVVGEICDSAGACVAPLRSTRLGMGTVAFVPEAGASYVAHIDGREFPLPASEPGAAVVTVDTSDSEVFTVGTLGAVPDGAVLLAQCRGKMLYGAPVEPGEQTRIPAVSLGDGGVVQFILADSAARILSTRLAFVYPRQGLMLEADSVIASPGDYAVAVTADGMAVADTASSIVAHLLLQSELRGHVEDAAYYLQSPDSTVCADVDALLLTQGWERYDIPAAFACEFAKPEYPLEIGGEITGIVKSRWRGKPLPGAEVYAIAPKRSWGSVATTDKQGRFNIAGFDWADGVDFIFTVRGPNGNREHNYVVDTDKFPWSAPLPVRPGQDRMPLDELTLLQRGILLNEVEVLGIRPSSDLILSSAGGRVWTSDYFAERGITTYEEALRLLPLRVVGGNIVLSRGPYSIYGQRPVSIFVDNAEWTPAFGGTGSLNELSMAYPFNIIERIEFLGSAHAASLSSAGNGALSLTTKSEYKNYDPRDALFVQSHRPLGYQAPRDAYIPHFQWREAYGDEPAVQTAIWAPCVPGGSKVPCLDGQTPAVTVISGILDSGMPVQLIRR